MNCGFNVSSTLLASPIFCFFYPDEFNTNIQHCVSLLIGNHQRRKGKKKGLESCSVVVAPILLEKKRKEKKRKDKIARPTHHAKARAQMPPPKQLGNGWN
ncbi:hypothetical protein I7I48_10316 [Histoplasma ohiense]|nr:hypothetical protein I7I48_10316 [Histoplasma ohiense (nom. inval.)]